uniref:Nudix hydrolase domain-containing protein n=1 Tax=Calcidiscus leptoporus TaxID=127549 RepID=A0A7S0IRD5_9EUKA|mmetsp:Transcript_18807/g.43226  ORF Transcript_18807/g.43226 Transcript_18807/m.43226 type:complete len:245 (+) Transcript_18807:26-760(+)|eukprot:CAMPEP_0119361792 /NCGR_PEP_ID=MMETSP1334-20130426/9034_1 /TAXON_ID=127549 /ORGANISM="Calcidiscus leptoporus, Strain RCC1130" /LENGTH=244 /DNA_ID=CAMNT_0007376899 /DNA_START=17 /DNA_END=751 /DNA_ORIENTATION=+
MFGLHLRLASLFLASPRLVPFSIFTRSLRNGRGPAATLESANAFGQDLSEMFELYEPPHCKIEPLSKPPVPLGVRKPRGEVHADGDWHRSVHVWLRTLDGRLLLQRRSQYKDTHPGMWDVSCAGHISAGDDSLGTARKELEEELGVSVDVSVLRGALLCTLPSCARGATTRHGPFVCNEIQDIYLVQYPAEQLEAGALSLESGEVEAIELLDARKVLQAWERAELSFVPRPPHYVRALREGLGL